MVELQRIESTQIDAICGALETDGACIALNVLSPRLCDQLLADFQQPLDALNWGTDDLGYRDDFYGTQTKRLHGLFSHSPHMEEVLTHPLFRQMAQNLLVESGVAQEVRLSNSELMVLNQDQDNQVFHTDAVSWPRAQQSERDQGHEILVSANCALTEFTPTNGATRVVPGSHRWEVGREPKPEEVCLAVMPKGSALLYTGNAVHSGGANTERDARVGLYLGYVVSWLRPIENHLVTNRLADIQAMRDVAQRLLDVTPEWFTVYA